MFKKMLLISLCSSYLFAYKVGDSLDKDITKQLNLQNEKIYIVDFFASWCKSCKHELPLISKLNTSLKNKYELLGISIDEDKKLGEKFVKDLNLNFNVIYDESNILVSKFNPIGVPAIYYIKNKKVVKTVFGAVANIDKKIKKDLDILEQK